MTPEEFEPLAVWMGWEKKKMHPEHNDMVGWYDAHFHGEVANKTSLTPAECYGALERLVEKGYCPEMYYSVDSEGFAAWYFTENPCDRALYYVGRTANEAIEQCLKHLAAAIEGGNE